MPRFAIVESLGSGASVVVRAIPNVAVGDVFLVKREDIGGFGTHPSRPCLVVELQGPAPSPARALVVPGSRRVLPSNWPYLKAEQGEGGLEVETYFKFQHYAALGIRRLGYATRVGRLSGLRNEEIARLLSDAKENFGPGRARPR